MKKKPIIQIIAGAILLIFGLFVPLFIGMELLPDGWADAKNWTRIWWSVPMIVVLMFTACGCICGGPGLILSALDTRKWK